MSCEEIRPDLVAYLDGELSNERRQALEGHLSGCEGCARRLGEFRRAREALAAQPALEAVPGYLQRVMARSREASRGGFSGRFLRWLAPAAALAAGALIVALWPSRPAPEVSVEPADELEIASEFELYADYELIAELDVLSDLEAIESLEDEG
ncbi:MAG: hypothetical protein GYA21_16335 [Myxococcales bacterium]|nr:hypothetical protein [Myxococcales bacterium]